MSIRRIIAIVAIVASVSTAPVGAAGPKTKYERVLEQENDLRLGRKPSPLSHIRKTIAAYENVARQYPGSGYADNALWQGASLALSAFRIYQSDVDRATAARLLQWLVDEYPSSSLRADAVQAMRKAKPPATVAKTRTVSPSAATSAANLASVKALAENRAAEEVATRNAAAERAANERAANERAANERLAAERAASERAAAERAAVERAVAERAENERLASEKAEAARLASMTRVSAVTSSVPSSAPSSGALPQSVTLKDVKRTTIGDLVRVTLEFDGEVDYRQERIESPSRLYFDLKRTHATPALTDAVLTYTDTTVKNIRLGRPRQDTTRLVIDLDGVDSYSVFALYNPYRLTIDLRRSPAPPVPTLAKNLNSKPESTLAGAPVAPKPVAPETRIPPRPLPHPLASRTAPTVATRAVSEIVDAPLPLIASAPSLVPVSVMAIKGMAFPRVSSVLAAESKRAETKAADIRLAEVKAIDGKTTSGRQSTTVAKVTPPPPAAVRQPVTPLRPTPPPPPLPSYAAAAPDAPAPTAPSANASGGFSIARQLGLGVSRIVIDPGHGGHDSGSLGAKVQEKEIVLDVALRLEKLLQAEPGFDIVMTRRTDVFIPLEERTALANRHQADLFLSIHTNSSRNKQAGGVETYYLNFASNPEAEEVAARENAGAAQTMNHLPEIVKAIALNNKLDESRDLAQMVQESMVGGLKTSDHQPPNRGVKQAPFVVLIGAGMPSVLAEISFITNANEGSLMKTGAYRQKVAESLFAAVKKYQRSLKNVGTVASQVTMDDANDR